MKGIGSTTWRVPAITMGALLGMNLNTGEAAMVSGNFSAGITIGSSEVSKPPQQINYTWGAAEISLKRTGITQVGRLAKMGDLYLFSGKRNGQMLKISVSAHSGKITNIQNLRPTTPPRIK